MGRWVKKTAVVVAFVAGLLVGSPIAVMASSAYYEWVNLAYNSKVEVTTQAIAFNGHPYLLATDVEKYLNKMGLRTAWSGRTLDTYATSSSRTPSGTSQYVIIFGKSALVPTFDASKLPQTFTMKSDYEIKFNSIALSNSRLVINVTVTGTGPASSSNPAADYPVFDLSHIDVGPVSYRWEGNSSVLDGLPSLGFLGRNQSVSGNLYYQPIPIHSSYFTLTWTDFTSNYAVKFDLTK
ncbi:MAG: hypothetical protein ACYCYO_01980 [Bacilli bacterium]